MKPYYQHGGITIYHGDAHEVLPGVASDCMVVDPPYGVGKVYGEHTLDDVDGFRRNVALIADDGRPACVSLGVSRIFDLPKRPQWIGAWTKRYAGFALRSYPFYPHWEPLAFYNVKGDFSGNRGHRSDVFEFDPIRAQAGGHPCPKLEPLVAELIRFFRGHLDWSSPRFCVADAFMGTGTTLFAAKSLGCDAVGIEIEERWCEVAAKRMSQEILEFA